MFKQANIIGIKGDLFVNNDGTEIKHIDKQVNLFKIKGKKHPYGYMCCSINGKQLYVHKIVAQAFVQNPKPLSYKYVMHLDGNTLNNNSSNLMWGDIKLFNKKRKELGLSGENGGARDKSFRGRSKISYTEALKIARRLDAGEYASHICKEYNVSEMSIIRIRKRYCKNSIASPRYPEHIKKTVLQLAKKYSVKKTSEISGVNYFTIMRWKKSLINQNQ